MGEIGFSHELTNYKEETDERYLYYPIEYYDEKPVIDDCFDIWSLGCVFHEICTGDKVFNDKLQIIENKLPTLSHSKFDHSLMTIIEEMLQMDRKDRPNSKFILKFLVSLIYFCE